MTFQLTSTDELVERGTFEELRRFLTNLLDRRGHSAAATRVSWWDEDTPPTPDIRGAFWSVVAGGTLYEIHNQHARMSWLDPDVFGPATHVLTLDDVEIHRGTFAACALTMSSRFTGHSLEILARLEALEAGLSGFREGPVVGSLRLAAFSTAVRGLVAPALRELWKGHPGLEVTVLEHDPHDAIEQVATGSTDLALVHNWGDLPLPFPAHLDVEQIGTDTADVLLHRGHRLAGAALLTPQDLADEALNETWLRLSREGEVGQVRDAVEAGDAGLPPFGRLVQGEQMNINARLHHTPPQYCPQRRP